MKWTAYIETPIPRFTWRKRLTYRLKGMRKTVGLSHKAEAEL